MRTSLKKSQMLMIEKVEWNEELLTIILVRLPPISIFKFKCVSKRWNSILNNSYFHESYSTRIRNYRRYGNGVGRLMAFVQERMIMCTPTPNQCTYILPVDQPNRHKIKRLSVRLCSLNHCSGGLIICNTCDYGLKYRVVNPLTKTWVELPKANFGHIVHLGLICEENKEKFVPSFRVVGIVERYCRHESRDMFIGTYTSETGKWESSKLIVTELLCVTYIRYTFVFNGVFHWYIWSWCSEDHMLAVYESNASDRHVQVIKLPLDSNCKFALTRSTSDDVLWVGMSHRESITFWMLPKDEKNWSYKRRTTITKDEWILMYKINYDYLSKEMTLLLENDGYTDTTSARFNIGGVGSVESYSGCPKHGRNNISSQLGDEVD